MTGDRIVLSNFIWRVMERWGAQGVTFVVSIILARVLEPEVYGTIALVSVFMTLLQVFIDSGLGTALIQKKDADDLDFSSVFLFNIAACVALYGLLFLSAPAISRLYGRPELIPVVRILGLGLIISGVKNIQQAYISKHLLFRVFFFSTLGGTIGAAAVGILLAYRGFGVWALVAQYLTNNLLDTVILWIFVQWRPKAAFSRDRFRTLFSYGWKMLLSSLIDTAYNELRVLIIGKFYSGEDLAYYEKGSNFPKVVVNNVNSSMNSVLLPVLAQRQSDLRAVKAAARRTIRLSSFVIWPLMIGLCVVADKLVLVLLTEKWLPAVAYLRIICFNQALQPLQTTNLSVVKALGRADIHLRLEIAKKTIAILIVIASATRGVLAIAVGTVVYAGIASVLNAYPNRKLIDYGYLEQLRDIGPSVALSAAMGVPVYLVGRVPMAPLAALAAQVAVGVCAYVLLSKLTGSEEYRYCAGLVGGFLARFKG